MRKLHRKRETCYFPLKLLIEKSKGLIFKWNCFFYILCIFYYSTFCFCWSYYLLIYLARDQSLHFSNIPVSNSLWSKHRWEKTTPYKGNLGNQGDKSGTVLPIALLTTWQSKHGMVFYCIPEKENNEIMNSSKFDWLAGVDDLSVVREAEAAM